MRRFIDVVRALIASGERTFWLAAMAVQPLLTQLLKRKYTVSGTDAELERFFERHFVSGDRGESDSLGRYRTRRSTTRSLQRRPTFWCSCFRA